MMKQNSTSSDIRAGSSQPELFTADGHLTDLAFKLLIDEQLDSLQSLEVSEHLSFCDRCLERYTEILCSDAPVDLDTGQELPEVVHLMEPPASLHDSVMQTIQNKTRVFYFKKAASVAVAASLTFVFWSGGILSDKNFSKRVNNLLDGLYTSSQSILEQTSEISDSINDFFHSIQNSFHQPRHTPPFK